MSFNGGFHFLTLGHISPGEPKHTIPSPPTPPFTARQHLKHHRSFLNQMNGKPSKSMPQPKSLREN